MRRNNLNLAQKPFANYRPVVRVTTLLWVLGGLLFVANFFLYWTFYGSQGKTRETLAEIRAASDREEARIAELQQAVVGYDLTSQNRQTLFLNDRIRERTFGWSALFDTLADILPRDARLERLSPKTEQRRTGRGRADVAREGESVVQLEIQGRARNQESFYELLESLIGSPAFRRVNPRTDSVSDRDEVSFVLSTQYLPNRADEQLGLSLEESLADGELLPATLDDSLDDFLDDAPEEAAPATDDARILRPTGRPQRPTPPPSVSEDEAAELGFEEEET